MAWGIISIAWVSYWLWYFLSVCHAWPDGSMMCNIYFLHGTDVVEGIFEMPMSAYIVAAMFMFIPPVAVFLLGAAASLLASVLGRAVTRD
jgi:hypothetical protein